MIFDMSEHQVFPRKYLVFFKDPRPWGAQVPKSAFLGAIRPLFRFWAPKMHFWAQKAALAPPAQNPL